MRVSSVREYELVRAVRLAGDDEGVCILRTCGVRCGRPRKVSVREAAAAHADPRLHDVAAIQHERMGLGQECSCRGAGGTYSAG